MGDTGYGQAMGSSEKQEAKGECEAASKRSMRSYV